MGFFSSGKNNNLVALFGISSGSVGGALVEYSKNTKGELQPKIIAQARTEMAFQEELDFERFFIEMQKALKKTAEKIYSEKKGAPKHIVCTLGSPWYFSETRIIHYEKPKDFLVTRKLMEDLLSSERKVVEQSYKTKYEKISGEAILLENKILHTSMNGYSIDNPIGKQAKSLDMHLFISLSPKVCISGIEESLQKFFHHTPISYTSFMTSFFITARDRYATTLSCLLIDMNAEISDIGLVSDGILSANISFPLGRNYILRTFKEKLKMTEEQISSALSMISSNTMSDTEKNRLAPVLNKIKEDWCKMFREALAKLPKTLYIPDTALLVSENDISSWFTSMLREEDYVVESINTNKKKFNVIPIQGSDLLDMCQIKNGACDQFLMVDAIALNRILEK